MSSQAREQILALADQCVRCGMCLPHCPTNQLTNLEGHSPRGRIALWQNLAEEKLALTKQTYSYLSQCLSCGACVNSCPAGVNFLELQDLGKNFLRESKNIKNIGKLTGILIAVFSSRILTNVLHYILYFYQFFKLPNILSFVMRLISDKLPLSKFKKQIINLNHAVPNLKKPVIDKQLYKTSKEEKEKKETITDVVLFTGCVNKLSQHKINSAINILNKLGFSVHLLKDLHCCGALYQHNGLLNKYQNLCESNQRTVYKFLNNQNILYLLTLDTGCHPSLQQQFNQQDNIEVINIEQFICHYITSNSINITQLINNKSLLNKNLWNKNIYIYTPCSQREQLKTPYITKELLSLFLDIAYIKQVPVGYGCCGAAGTYMFEHDETATKLTQKIIDDLLVQEPMLPEQLTARSNSVIICTSNIGCSIQIKKVLSEKYNIDCTLMHPLEIVSELM